MRQGAGKHGNKFLASEDFDQLVCRRVRVARGRPVRQQAALQPDLYLVLTGWLASSLTLPNGRRRVVGVHLPNDLAGLISATRPRALEAIYALTDAEVGVIDAEKVRQAIQTDPQCAASFARAVQDDHVRLAERLALDHGLSAAGRIAAFLLDMAKRSGPTSTQNEFALPMTQSDVGELIGLTPVHVNRTLKTFRDQGLVKWASGSVTILNRKALLNLTMGG